MAVTIVQSVLTGKLEYQLLIKWLNDESIEDSPEDCILLCCNRSDFVAHFLSYLRNQTESFLQTNINVSQTVPNQKTPEKPMNPRRKHHRSISDPTNDTEHNASLTVRTECNRRQESPNRDRKKRNRVKTKLFTDEKSIEQSISSDESKLSFGVDRMASSSTPVKNGVKPEYPSLLSPVSPLVRHKEDRCDTPRLSQKHSRSQEKSISFGDYLVIAQRSAKKKKSKNTSNEPVSEQQDLDLSNSDIFPEIGAKKSNSKRRVKPTQIVENVSQQSGPVTSFSSDYVQKPSPMALEENSVFKPLYVQPKELPNSYERERNMLKKEKQKVMELFNSSMPMAVKSAPPQIKIFQKEHSIDNQPTFVKADPAKVDYKEKLDVLIEIYDILLKKNLILSYVTEIYFLISLLLSKQKENDYLKYETGITNENCYEFILKSIHNCTYFAVKSLYTQKSVLELILEKNSLKILGENKNVRSFCPDLAKSLLNCYGLKCEEEGKVEPVKPVSLDESNSNSVVRFNQETDNADNFPTLISFQNFKKQRDMFYEILRAYRASGAGGACGASGAGGAGGAGGARSSLRGRLKALLGAGPTPSNCAHLAALVAASMAAECLHSGHQESRLSKLQRRFTSPAVPESHRLPAFSSSEAFYRDFLLCADSESLRVHLRDALASELAALDGTPLASEDRTNSASRIDLSRDYLVLVRRLCLLGKFLGFLTSLPYWHAAGDGAGVGVGAAPRRDPPASAPACCAAPAEKIHENHLALRNYSQPCIDVQGMLRTAEETGRLTITVPWIVQYLSMLDYTSLRINYYRNLIRHLFDIYTGKLVLSSDSKLKKNTVIFLKTSLGWLFDLPHFPHEAFAVRDVRASVASASGVDSCDLIDEAALMELCPRLKDIGVLLATCRVANDQREAGSFKHVTPVTLVPKPEDLIKNREKELQSKLEEEFLRSQPSSTRRVFELVVERVAVGCVREAAAGQLAEARAAARLRAAGLVRAAGGAGDAASLLESLRAAYSEQLGALRARAQAAAAAEVERRTAQALGALLPGAPALLRGVAARAAAARVRRWLADNWNTTAVLCKDIEAEMRTLLALGEHAQVASKAADVSVSITDCSGLEADPVSPAVAVIDLKESVARLLGGERGPEPARVLRAAAAACSRRNPLARAPARRALLQLSLDLCLVQVSRKPKEVTEEFLKELHAVWDTCCPERKRNAPKEIELPERRDISPEMRDFDDEERAPTPVSDEEAPRDVEAAMTCVKSPTPCVKPLTDCVKMATECVKSPTTCVKSLTDCVKTATECVKSPTTCVKIATECVKSPTDCVKIATTCVKSPTDRVKSPTDCVKTASAFVDTPTTPNGVSSLIDTKIENTSSELLDFFNRVLCPRNIVILNGSKCDPRSVWEALASVLVFMLENGYLSEESLTEQCLAVYTQEWPQSTQENLSTCMKEVSTRWSKFSAGEFKLILDFMSEYCRDMDYESFE